jgi:lysyl-tRNA synthetase class 2
VSKLEPTWLVDQDHVRFFKHFLPYLSSESWTFLATGNLGTTNNPDVQRFREDCERSWSAAERTFGSLTPLELTDVERGNLIVQWFELVAERNLIQPTFITDFPKPVSPLSKASPSDPSIAERFEYFVAGLESGNGFSELNDPEEQYQRFKDQVGQRERGDEEAMVMDEDYIRALSYGMPPAAGIGLGIDRLVMLLANKQSIRDVIMFPHMRPERRADDEGSAGQ